MSVFAKLVGRRPLLSRMDSEANLSEAAVGALEITDIQTAFSPTDSTGGHGEGAYSVEGASSSAPSRTRPRERDPDSFETGPSHSASGSSTPPHLHRYAQETVTGRSSSRSPLPFAVNPRTSSRSSGGFPLDGIEGDSGDDSTSDDEEQRAATPPVPPGRLPLSPTVVVQHLGERAAEDFDNTFEQPHPNGSTNPRLATRSGIADIDAFLHKPIPMGQKVLCEIRRRRDGLDKLSPRYELYIEESDDNKVFVLSAQKRRKSSTSHYKISKTRFPGKDDKEHVVASVRSNFLGTAFAIYEHGTSQTDENGKSIRVERQEYGAALYEPNLLGFKGPRKMTVILPTMTKEGKRSEFRPSDEKESLFGRYRSGNDRDILTLHNKAPQWNEETQSFVLNFNGRVTHASVKNFQIVHDNDLDYIVMQFGRVSEDTFSIDFQYPMSCIQAFAIALTSFDAKLACE
ncbi:tubby protein-like protein [Phlyctochytrium arcticum]|nr:tubby protein-like protein [Phlyctochytrium arcticum]